MGDVIKLPKTARDRLAALANMKFGDIEDDPIDPPPVVFIVMNPGQEGTVTTCYTDVAEARGAAIWFLDIMCQRKGIEPPTFWELRLKPPC